MNNGKQDEQLLKVLSGHSASLDRTSKMQRAKGTAKLYSGGHKAMQHEKGTSRQRSGKGAIRKRFPLQKPRWEKTKLTIRYLYHETYRKPNEQLFSQ